MKIIKLGKWYNGQEKNNFPRTVVDSNSNSRAEEGKIYRRTLRDFISDQIYLRNFFAPGRIKNFWPINLSVKQSLHLALT